MGHSHSTADGRILRRAEMHQYPVRPPRCHSHQAHRHASRRKCRFFSRLPPGVRGVWGSATLDDHLKQVKSNLPKVPPRTLDKSKRHDRLSSCAKKARGPKAQPWRTVSPGQRGSHADRLHPEVLQVPHLSRHRARAQSRLCATLVLHHHHARHCRRSLHWTTNRSALS